MQLKTKKLTSTAKLPTRSNPTDAGLDLYIDAPATLLVGQSATLPTGIAVAIPDGYVGLIWPRSKLASQCGLDTLAGVVDASYRGEIMVNVINHGRREVELRAGDKVAQMLIQPVSLCECVEIDTLDETERGAHGINDSELRLR